MFHEQIQMEALRLSQEVKQRTQVEHTLSTQKSQEELLKGKEIEEITANYLDKEKQKTIRHEENQINLQKKVDILTEEVFQVLFEELGTGFLTIIFLFF